MRTQFHFPTKIIFGHGVVDQVAQQLQELGGLRPLVITDSGLMSVGIPERISNQLKKEGMQPVCFDGVKPNPTDDQVEAGATVFKTHQADCIVAVGGGSSLDTGKAVQIRINHHAPLDEYDDLLGGDAKILNPLPPLIAVPTTAGTGSEVSRSAVITIASVDRKVVLFSPRLMPSAAICDPELSYGLPPRITAETGMDALSHHLEAFLSQGYHPMADAIAVAGLRMITDHLTGAVENGQDETARREMLMASTMGAVAFQKGLGVVHSLAHALSSVAGVSHGLANSIMLPHAVRFNAQAIQKRIPCLSHHLKAGKESAEGIACALENLAVRIGLPTTLGQAGVSSNQLPKLVKKAMADGCHLSNPRKCSNEDMQTILHAAL